MKQKFSKYISRLGKNISLTTALFFYCLQLAAAPEDHGRWTDFDDFSPSPIMIVIGLLLLFLVSGLFIGVNKGKEGDRVDFWMGVVGVATVIIFILVKCS